MQALKVFMHLIAIVHTNAQDVFDKNLKRQCESAITQFLSPTDQIMKTLGSDTSETLVEGDMIFVEKEMKRYSIKRGHSQRPHIENKWPDKTVRIKYGSPSPNRDFIQAAMNEWSSKTCIRFAEGGDDAVTITKGNDCSASLGYNTAGGRMSLAEHCGKKVAVHLLGHLIGLRHQHSRPDRDDHLIIQHQNALIDNMMYFNYKDFDKCPYDKASIMQYDLYGLSVNRESVFHTKDTISASSLGNGWKEITNSDASLVNREYGCREIPCSDGKVQSSSCSKAGVVDGRNHDSRYPLSRLITLRDTVSHCVWAIKANGNCVRAGIVVELGEPSGSMVNKYWLSGCRLFQLEVYDPVHDFSHFYCATQFIRQSSKAFMGSANELHVYFKLHPSNWGGVLQRAMHDSFVAFMTMEDYLCTCKVDELCGQN